MTQISELDS